MFVTIICHCIHDDLIKNGHPTSAIPVNYIRKVKSSGRQNIRIGIDTSLINNPIDTLQCNESGKNLIWNYGEHKCIPGDIVDQNKLNVLTQTLNNVKKYLESIISVDTLDYSFNLKYDYEMQGNYFPEGLPNKTISDYDLYLTVVVRPYACRAGNPSSTLASAIAFQYDKDSHRAVEGALFINAEALPNEPQDEYSESTNFFYTCIHEIFHVMGISASSYSYYHPRGSNTPYKEITCNILDGETGKNHLFLITPNAHKFAVYQWGNEVFSNGTHTCPSGIELEDGGGSGTKLSHPEMRISYGELMTGVIVQHENVSFNRFTPLSMAMLLDTGNYDIDYRKAQPLLWGNKEIIGKEAASKFVMGAPQLVFPQQYIHREDEDVFDDRAGFNFKYLGKTARFSFNLSYPDVDCSKPETQPDDLSKYYCSAWKFFNPLNKERIGKDEPSDFQVFIRPVSSCNDGEAVIGGLEKCAKYKIADDNKSFTIEINLGNFKEIECNETTEGKIIKIPSPYFKSFRCPPVKQFINTVTMYEKQKYITKSPFESYEPTNPPNESDSGNAGVIVTCVIIVVVLAIAAAVVAFIWYRKKHSQDDIANETEKIVLV